MYSAVPISGVNMHAYKLVYCTLLEREIAAKGERGMGIVLLKQAL